MAKYNNFHIKSRRNIKPLCGNPRASYVGGFDFYLKHQDTPDIFCIKCLTKAKRLEKKLASELEKISVKGTEK